MKEHDLTVESLLRTIHESRVLALCSFEQKMAYAPRNKFFVSEADKMTSMENRIAFLHVLEKKAKASGNFRLTDDFVKDFIERND